MSTPDNRKTVHELALSEMDQWKGRDELSAFGRDRIGTYWAEGVGVPRDMYGPEVPWSGAFVAWVVRSVAPRSLAGSGRHSVYAKAAINAKRDEQYSAYPAYVVKDPAPGDIIIKGRPGFEHSFGELHADESIPSHGDIIVQVTPYSVVAIGGNKTGNTVTSEIYPRLPDGSVGGGVFAILIRGRGAPLWYFADPAWRRARDAEVTEAMRADAVTAVRELALGELLYGEDYLIAVETHYDDKRGHHRGASVFVPSDVESVS